MKLTKEQKTEVALTKKKADELEQCRRDSFLVTSGNAIRTHLGQLRDDDSRRDFLTEIFCLTEDLRYELSESDTTETPLFDFEEALVPCGTIPDDENPCDRKERSNEDPQRTGGAKLKDLKEFTSVAVRKSDRRKFLYRYLITKVLVKILDTETGESSQLSQTSFLRAFKPLKKLNNKNRKRNFMNYGRNRVA